jgi:hypothetical protein
MKHNSHLTAITRKRMPVPTRWLINAGLVDVEENVLDFGCGKCGEVNPKTWDNYDPHYRPWSCWHKRSYRTIICNYVLCTLPDEERLPILKEIQRKLGGHDAIAYLSVRNDKPKQGWGKSSRGTYQGRVRKLNLPLTYKNSQFRIYQLTKDTVLC